MDLLAKWHSHWPSSHGPQASALIPKTILSNFWQVMGGRQSPLNNFWARKPFVEFWQLNGRTAKSAQQFLGYHDLIDLRVSAFSFLLDLFEAKTCFELKPVQLSAALAISLSSLSARLAFESLSYMLDLL